MDDDVRERFQEIRNELQDISSRHFVLKNKFDKYVALQQQAGEFMKEDTARMARAASEQAATVTRIETRMNEWTSQQEQTSKSRASLTAWLVCLAPVAALAIWEWVKHGMGWH